MAKIDVDPDEMHRFAVALEKSRGKVVEKKKGITVAFDKLHNSWSDKKYEQFAAVFREAMRGLNDFDKLAGDYARALKVKAQKGKDYLR